MKDTLYKAIVKTGDKKGREIGFPTINLSPDILSDQIKQGVYHSGVIINGQKYQGALYFGPRLVLDETHTVLEIHILDFSGNLYDKDITFSIQHYIRPPQDFGSFEEMIATIKQDILAIRKLANTD